MRALFRWELRRRWKSSGAWLFLLIHSGLAAWFLYSSNLVGGTAGFETLYRWNLRALCLTCPLLCWGGYARDRKNDAWKRLFARGVCPLKLAFARLLAASSVSLAAALILTTGPFVLSRYTIAYLPGALCAASAYLAVGCLLCGFCLWMETLVRPGWLSAVLCAAISAALCLIPNRFGHAYLFPITRLDGFLSGVFDLADWLIYVVAACGFAALAAASLFRLRSPRKWKKPLAAAAAALAAVVLAASLLPLMGPSLTSADATRIRAVTPAEEAGETLAASDAVIDAYYISSVRDPWVEGLMEKYQVLNGRFRAHYVDLRDHPDALDGYYGAEGQDNCLVLESGGRYVVIPSHNVYAYSYAYDASSGAYVPTDLSFAAQAQLLSAVRFLSNEDAPVITALTDHFESTVGEYARQMAYEAGMFLRKGTAEQALEGDCVLIFAPQQDITAGERDLLIQYLQKGGGLMVATNYQYGNFENLFAVLEYCGMAPQGTLAIETNESLYMSYPYYPAPAAAVHGSTKYVTGVKIVVPTCHGIAQVQDLREGLVLTPLLATSTASYLKTADATTMNYEETDVRGPVTLAMAAEDGALRCVWISGSDYLSDSMFTLNTANLYFWVGQAQWTAGKSGLLHSVSVEAPSMTTNRLALSGAQKWLPLAGYALCILLSAAMLIVGLKRKKS